MIMKNPYFVYENNSLRTIDQRKLPLIEDWIQLKTIDDYFTAIKKLKVRGAPAIGVTAAFGVLSAISNENSIEKIREKGFSAIQILSKSRPTAVNLFYALNKIKAILNDLDVKDIQKFKDTIKDEVFSIFDYEIDTCNKMADFGNELIKEKMNVLTHCNTGMLASPGIGTALGIVYRAFEMKKDIRVYVPETRPLLQGGRLTIYELNKAGIPYTLLTDNMRGYIFDKGLIDIVIVGADRIAINGDTANKIGTYESAVLAKAHNIPFYITAPISTIDFSIDSGKDIIVEHRDANEITSINGKKISIAQNTINPAFDITPNTLINGIITEKGIVKPCRKEINQLSS